MNADWVANFSLALGVWSDQLGEAAAYYLQVKASAPANATITFTGHSLGGGLAALMSVFFGEASKTFDQAPFANSATSAMRDQLVTYLEQHGYTVQQLTDLAPALMSSSFDPAVGAMNVTNISTAGEFLSLPLPNRARIGLQIPPVEHGPADWFLSSSDLHSQALLTTFLQSQQTATTGRALSDVTVKLPDLLKMIFDRSLFYNDPNDKEVRLPNLLEHLVQKQAAATDPAIGMVSRFNNDLWKLAQDGGLTLHDGNPSNPALNEVSKTLIAFAMQKYYEEQTAGSTLFSDVSGGIRFDMADVSNKFAAAIQANQMLNLSDAKGYQYFANYLKQGSLFTQQESALIQSVLPQLRDWYVQAGANGMNATDTLNRGAFMLGGSGADTLAGGAKADLLVGNAGDDTLTGGGGSDVLIGGAGADTYIWQAGQNAGIDTLLDSDNTGYLRDDTPSTGSGQASPIALTGGAQFGDNRVFRGTDANGTSHLYTYVTGNGAAGGDLIADGAILVKNYNPTAGNGIGLTMSGPAADTTPTTTRDVYGDLTPDGTGDKDALDNLVTNGVAAPDRADGLYDSAANDHIISGGGDDFIYAWRGGDDVIEAGTGRDKVYEFAGNDIIMGGAGGDILSGGTDNDRIYADTQVDVATAISQGNAQTGTGLQGDWLAGNSGDDTLVGGTADDVLTGGAGRDLLIGGAGNDDIMGDVDWVAQVLDWTVTEQPDGSRLFNGVENQLFPTVGAADVIYAGEGSDHAWGGFGNDVIFGEGGDDTLAGNSGNDILIGGAGKDLLLGDTRDSENLAAPFQPGSDYLDGGVGDDTIYGNEGGDIIVGGKDNDNLYGGSGQDTYIYNAGDGIDNVYDTKADNNILRFGAGVNKDNIKLHLGSLMVDLGNGDAVHIEGFDRNDVFNSSSIGSFEFADGSTLTATELLARGFDIDGTELDDTLTGTNTTDRINGLGGDDMLIGGAGDDVLNGGTGADAMAGGVGDDLYVVDNIGDVVTEDFNAGVDTVQSSISFALGANIENLTLAGVGGVDGTGNALDNVITGNAANNVLDGGAGNDTLIGGSGLDTFVMRFGMGSDTIIGTSSQGGIVKLESGIPLFDLLAVKQGNDLELKILGSTESMLIKDYYSNPQTVWTIIDDTGNTVTAQNLLDATSAAPMSLSMTQLEGDFIAQARIEIAQSLKAQGAVKQSDGYYLVTSTYDVVRPTALLDTYYNGLLTVQHNVSYLNGGYSSYVSKENWVQVNVHNGIVDSSTSILESQTATNSPVIDAYSYYSETTQITKWAPVVWYWGNWHPKNYSQTVTVRDGQGSVIGYDQQVITPTSQYYGASSAIGWFYSYYSPYQENVPFDMLLSSPDGFNTTGAFPSAVPIYINHQNITNHIQQIYVGGGNHTVYGGKWAIVNAGTGNNDIYNAGFVYTGAGNNTIYGSRVVYCGTGDNTIRHANTAYGGNGNDIFMAVNNIFIDPNSGGNDLIGGNASNINGYQILDGYYRSQGINNWYASYTQPDVYSTYWGGVFSTSAQAEAYFQTWGITLQQAINMGYVAYNAPLPTLMTVNGYSLNPSSYYSTSGTPVINLTANNFTALDFLYGQGILHPSETVNFGAGVLPSDLRFSWGEVTSTMSDSLTAPQLQYTTLNITWGASNQNIQVIIPRSDDPVGSGVSKFIFADGLKLSMADMISMAPPVPSFDPGPSFIFQSDMGAHTLPIGTSTIQFAAGIAPTSVSVTQNSSGNFLISHGNGASALQIPAQSCISSIVEADFSNGTYWKFVNADNNPYTYTAGSGEVYLINPSDIILFGTGIISSMISLGIGSLMLRVGNSGDVLHIEGFNPADALNSTSIKNLQFADGSALTYSELLSRGFDIYGTGGDDTLSGTNLDNRIYGGNGNDVLIGSGIHDTLNGGAGNDRYVFNSGDGVDIIVDALGNDTLYIGSGLIEANLEGVRDGDNMIVNVLGTTGFITLTNWFVQGEGVSRIELSDGSSLDYAGIEGLLNRPPVANPDAFTVYEDGGVTNVPAAALLANDTDPNTNDVISVISVGTSAVGASVALVSGQVQYDIGNRFQELGAGQTVTDSFAYTISDSKGVTASSIVNVTITGVNDAPVTADDAASVQEDLALVATGNVLGNDSDVDQGTVLSVADAGLRTGSYGQLTLAADGNYSYAPDNASPAVQSLAVGQTVTDNFAYQATDGLTATPSTLTVTITGTNDVPVAAADAAYVREDLNITPSIGSGQAPSNLDGTGNVLSNDSDVDQGTVLTVADAGVRAGSYGSLTLAADGSYSYAVNNASQAVQSLGRTAQVAEHFGYTATDGIVGASAVLDVFLNGANDAPILVAPLADQNLTIHKHFSWQMPEGSFTDIDQGDTLTYGATLADGSALPDWLKFDAATRTFSGETPKRVGFVDVRVTATDSVAATGSTAGSLSASDVFRVSVSHGNEGVGNGEDASPPGHDHNTNDGAGTSPGHPGSRGGNGQQASGDYAHGRDSDHDGQEKHKDDSSSHGSKDSDSRRTDELIRTWFEEQSASERYSSFGALDRHGAWGGQIDRQVNRNVARGLSDDVRSEWERMNARLKEHLERSGGDEGLFAEPGTGSRSFGLFGSGGQQGILQLDMGSDQQLKALAGLKEGLERLGG